MSQRIKPAITAPETYKAVRNLEAYVREAGIDAKLLHLLKVRASQLNKCAFCIDMHVKEALDDGEDPQRLYLLPAWQESPLYSERERALLAWTEALTLLPEKGAPDELYAALRQHFAEAEIVNLTVAIGMINLWNRWSVAFGSPHPIGMEKRVG